MGFLWFKTAEEKRGLSSNLMRIYIYTLQNKTPVLSGTFLAQKERDKSQNIIIKNENKDFKEELFIKTDPLIAFITTRLKTSGNSKTEQLTAINKKIDIQEKILFKLKDGKLRVSDIPLESELLEKVKDIIQDSKDKKPVEYLKLNIVDEEEKLRLYKVSKYTIENEQMGSYETIDEDQLRAIHFVSQDGLLYPYCWGSNRINNEILTIHQDVSTAKKYYKSEDDLIEEERRRDMQDKVGNILKILGIIAIVLLIGINIFWSIQNSKQASKILDQWDKSTISQLLTKIDGSKMVCTEALSNQVENNQVFLDYAKIKIKEEQSKIEQSIPQTTKPITKI